MPTEDSHLQLGPSRSNFVNTPNSVNCYTTMPHYEDRSTNYSWKRDDAKHTWSLANTECAMCWYDALTRTETVELRDKWSQVDDSSKLMLANATHDNRNTSWLDASRHRSNNNKTSSTFNQSTHRLTREIVRYRYFKTAADWITDTTQHTHGFNPIIIHYKASLLHITQLSIVG